MVARSSSGNPSISRFATAAMCEALRNAATGPVHQASRGSHVRFLGSRSIAIGPRGPGKESRRPSSLSMRSSGKAARTSPHHIPRHREDREKRRNAHPKNEASFPRTSAANKSSRPPLKSFRDNTGSRERDLCELVSCNTFNSEDRGGCRIVQIYFTGNTATLRGRLCMSRAPGHIGLVCIQVMAARFAGSG